MKRTILLAAGLFVLSSSVEALAERYIRDGFIYYRGVTLTRGKKGRKYVRRFSLQENLIGDKARIYEEYGYTPHRLRYHFAGKRTERWKYYSLGVEFTFDEEGNLISTDTFPPESGHID